jgi:hypothetical protein
MSFLFSQALLGVAVTVVASGHCPSAEDVEARLRQLLPAPVGEAAGEPTGDQSILRELADGSVELELRSSAGTVLRRYLPARASCAEQADIAATVIAAWQVELKSALPAPARPPPSVPASAPQKRRAVPSYELSAALVTSVLAAGATAGGWLEGSVMLCACGVSARFGILGIGLRSVPLGPGSGVFTRAAARVGVGYRILPRAFTLDVAADLPLALLYGAGEGFDNNQTALGFDVGLSASLRLGRRLGPVQPFVEAALVGWLRSSQLTVAGGVVDSVELPRLEALFSLGLTYPSGDTREKIGAP